MRAYYWFLLHMYIARHGSINVKFISPSKTDYLIIVGSATV